MSRLEENRDLLNDVYELDKIIETINKYSTIKDMVKNEGVLSTFDMLIFVIRNQIKDELERKGENK